MKIVKLYAIGVFVVCNVIMDGNFEKVKPKVELVDIISLQRVNMWKKLRDTTVR